MKIKRFLSMLLAATMILASGIFISMTNMGSTIVEATDSDPAKGDFTISGEKIWDDNNNEAGARPESVEIILYQNGSKIGEQKITAKDNWKYEFDLVDQSYNAEYTIDEEPVKNYMGDIVNPEISTAEILEYNWEQKHTPNNATKVLVDDKEIIAVKTTSANFNSIILVWTLYPLSSLEEEEIKVSIENIPELKNAGGYAFISGLGAIYGDGTSKNWIKIYKDNNGKQYIEFSHQKHWSMIFYGDIFVETQVFVTLSSITNIYKAPVLPTTSTEETVATTTTTEASTTEETTTTKTEETAATTSTTEIPTTEETTTTTTAEDTTTTTTEAPSETPGETVEPPVEEIITEPTTSETTSVTTVPASTTEPEFPHTGESGTPLWIPLLLAFTGIGSTIGAVVVRRKIY